ncbi:aldo/keto reductase [candidate division KSB1 bacterium]|nr:aldo/keto reductase [candidate division KSB1 bacterium]
MKRRKFGINGPELSELGFGSWTIGGPWQYGWGPVDDFASIEAIETALDSDINWIDTAPAYGLGHAEKVVGEVIKKRRSAVFLATKCGLVWDDNGKISNNLHPKSIRQEIEASLKRLQTDYIDLYQLHWPDKAHPVEKTWEELVNLKNSGKIRYLGVSNFDISLMERCQKIHPIDTLQPPYNLIRRTIESEILPYCQEKRIGVLAYSPLESGLLSGKFDITRLAADDWRRKGANFREPLFSHALNFIKKLQSIADKYEKTVGQLAIRWVLSNQVVTSAIVGARTKNQVRENLGAINWEISKPHLEEINLLSKQFFE